MPFPFNAVCDLLEQLENDLRRKGNKKGDRAIVEDWFVQYREQLDDHQTNRCALLSTLLPERRTDRVFGIKEKSLQPKIAKAFCLGHSRIKQLSRWTIPGSGLDLADCAEAILEETPNSNTGSVTVEDLDAILHSLAAKNSFSAPSVRDCETQSVGPSLSEHDGPLEWLFRRLSAREAKWATRLVLKSFLPVIVPEWLVYAHCHRLLPTVMKIHDNFTVATRLLEQERSRVTFGELEKEDLPRVLLPQIGVKVGRQTWLKGRSIKHCLEMGRGLTSMSVENKLDGEYCQIHIDLSRGADCIQIFSKSGKDSTRDKKRLHSAIRSSLGLGTPSCKIKQCCILEGEMVVYSDREQKILGFEKIRKHVDRSGRFIGTEGDSPAHYWEHLMIIYFDILRLDGESLLNVRHSQRFSRLSRLVQCQTGRSALVERRIINLSSPVAAEELREAFASCIVKREEGLVLKPDEPYFSFGRSRRKYASCCVKLKKGYLQKMGDVGDFAVVAARYCATKSKVLRLKMPKNSQPPKYTHFFIGCLTNREAVDRWDAKPEFMVVNEVEINATMVDFFKRNCFTDTVPLGDIKAPVLNVPPGIVQGKKISTVFTEPAVFDMTCFSFHKAASTRFWSLRFPYVSKIHSDRTWKDCMTFQELQQMAEDEMKCPEMEDSQELAQWIEALESNSRKTTSQESQTTDATVSTTASQPRTPQGLPTPPTSSAFQPSEDMSPGLRPSTPVSSCKKRREPSSVSSRRAKLMKHDVETIDLTSPTLSNSQPSQRQPLKDITSAPSSQGNLDPPPIPRVSSNPTECDVADVTKPGQPASLVPTQLDPSHLPPTPSPRRCEYAGGACALANSFVLLSPCIANMPLLIEDILPAHGVGAVFTDIASWLDSGAILPRNNPRRKPRRLVLVERHRNDPSTRFIQELESKPLRRRDGQVEIVLAYDWRLLEAITEEERRNQKGDGSGTRQTARTGGHQEELWRRYFIGCIDEKRDQ